MSKWGWGTERGRTRGGVGKEMAAIYSTDKYCQPCMAPSAMQVYTNTATLIGALAPNCINKDVISTHVRTYIRTYCMHGTTMHCVLMLTLTVGAVSVHQLCQRLSYRS